MTKKTICNKALLLSALFAAVLQAQEADVIFVGDNILTMDDAGAEAIAIRGEIIIAAGDRAEVMATRGGDTRVVELGEHALLPGFIDAHGHFSALSRYGDMLNLSSPPVGDVVSIEDLIRKIRYTSSSRIYPRDSSSTALVMMIRCLLRTDTQTAMTLILPAPGIR